MQKLTASEEIVMMIIWKANQPVSWKYIQEKADQMGHTWARQTISTFLLHLREKEFLSMERKGRQVFYTSLVDMEDYRSIVLKELENFFFEGNLIKFVEYIIGFEEITEN